MIYTKVSKADMLERINGRRYANATAARRAVGKTDLSDRAKKECYAAIEERDWSAPRTNSPKRKPTLGEFEKKLELGLYSTRKGALRTAMTTLPKKDHEKARVLIEAHDFGVHTFSGIVAFTEEMNEFLARVVQFGEDIEHRLSIDSLCFALYNRFGMYFKPETVQNQLRRLGRRGKMPVRQRPKSSITYVLPGTFEFSKKMYGDRGEKCLKLHPLPERFAVPATFISKQGEARGPSLAPDTQVHSRSTPEEPSEAVLRMHGIQFLAAVGDVDKAFELLAEIAGTAERNVA